MGSRRWLCRDHDGSGRLRVPDPRDVQRRGGRTAALRRCDRVSVAEDLRHPPGGRLGLYGFGASALLAMQVAVHWGCEVYVATRSERERERALELGAVWVGGYDDAPPVPLDAAVTFAPVGGVVVAALRAVRPGATVAINAIHLDEIPAFDYDLLWRERALRAWRTSPDATPRSSWRSLHRFRSGRSPTCTRSPRPTEPSPIWPAVTSVARRCWFRPRPGEIPKV